MNREPTLLKLLSATNGIFCVLMAARHLNLQSFSPASNGWWMLCAAALTFVYGLDLLLDSRKLKQRTDPYAALFLLGASLFFIWKAIPYLNRYGILPLVLQCKIPLLLTGIYLTGTVWLRLKWLRPFREILAAAIFGITLVYVQASDEPGAMACTVLFAGSCLANLLTASWYDYQKDAQYDMQGLLHTSLFPGHSLDHMRAIYALLLLLPPALLKAVAFLWPANYAAWNLSSSMLWSYVAQIGLYWIIKETEGTFRRYSLFRFASDWSLLLWLLV
ncbi:MAG: hypothetical protein KJS92_04690 [Bacteroidetes bacterium]|nr:hypothetical protein [Bacteroidota bacterium]